MSGMILCETNKTSMLQDVENTLAEPLSSVIEREQSALDCLLRAAKNKVVLFGAGNLGRRSLACLRRIGIEPLAITDRNSRLWGLEIDGCPVLSPKDAAERYGRSAVFIVTIWNVKHWYGTTRQQLRDSGCLHVAPVSALHWRFADEFLPFFCQDLPHNLYQQADQVVAAANLWADDKSCREYASQIRWRALGDWDWLIGPDAEDTYFPDNIFCLPADKAFVDCGASDGDTIQPFLTRSNGNFGSILAIEANTPSFLKLTAYISDLPPDIRQRISALHCAVGSKRGRVLFDDTAVAVVSEGGTSSVECFPLDDLLEDTPSSYLKMDIEGAEYDALIGAQKAITRDRPVLAVCVYHTQNDIWRIPLLIHEMVPDYRFYLRLHEGDCWQTVAYAVPPERVRTN
jgi:FkbM family methyltransferase